MVWKAAWEEDPELTYDDGARTIFPYTGGTEGHLPEELLQLARYMECSVSVNAQTAGLSRLHEMVMKVKADREVGAAYMNSNFPRKVFWSDFRKN